MSDDEKNHYREIAERESEYYNDKMQELCTAPIVNLETNQDDENNDLKYVGDSCKEVKSEEKVHKKSKKLVTNGDPMHEEESPMEDTEKTSPIKT